jgi:hypothetical protein
LFAGLISNNGQMPAAVGSLEKMLATGPLCKHAADLRPSLKIMAAENVTLIDLDKKVENVTSINVHKIEKCNPINVVKKIKRISSVSADEEKHTPRRSR